MKQIKRLYTKRFTTKDGIKLKLEVTKYGFTLWSEQNWLIDSQLTNGNVLLCKKVNRPWGAQRFDYELVADKVPREHINQWHIHRIKKVGQKG